MAIYYWRDFHLVISHHWMLAITIYSHSSFSIFHWHCFARVLLNYGLSLRARIPRGIGEAGRLLGCQAFLLILFILLFGSLLLCSSYLTILSCKEPSVASINITIKPFVTFPWVSMILPNSTIPSHVHYWIHFLTCVDLMFSFLQYSCLMH